MEKIDTYKLDFNLTEGMFDANVSFTPYAILDIFQELAGRHAYILGCGTPYIKARNIAWILAKQYVEIYDEPTYEGHVTAYTFPHKPSSIGGLRETVICNEDNKPIIRGVTLWVMVDLSNFSLIGIPKDIYGLDEYHESYFRKVPRVKGASSYNEVIDSYKVLPSDLDKYHHMNNAKYANFIINSLKLSSKDIKSFSIEYHNQAKLGDDIKLYKEEIDNLIILTGKKDDTKVFTINVERK